MLLYVIHFWWFEFGLSRIGTWEFGEYAFVIGYAALVFFITTLLFPDTLDGYAGYAAYFTSRRRWFYGFLAAMFAVDMIDSLMKGPDYFAGLGTGYPVRLAAQVALCLIAMKLRRARFDIAFGLCAIAAEIGWIAVQYRYL